MRTTLNIDDEMLEEASRLTGIKEKTALVRLGLEALIARESSKRLAKLGGTAHVPVHHHKHGKAFAQALDVDLVDVVLWVGSPRPADPHVTHAAVADKVYPIHLQEVALDRLKSIVVEASPKVAH